MVSLVQIPEDFEMFWGSVWCSVKITYWLYSETVHVLTITADTDNECRIINVCVQVCAAVKNS